MSKREWKNIWTLFLDIAGREKWTVFQMIVMALSDALAPFVRIWCLGLLLDGIYAGETAERLFGYLGVWLVSEAVCALISAWATENYNRKQDYTKDLESREMNLKSLTMDYEYLENTHVQELRTSAFARSFYGIRAWLLMNLHLMLKQILILLISLGVFGPVLLESGRNSSRLGMAGGLILLIMMFVGNHQVVFYYTKKANNGYDESMSLFHKKGYFSDLLAGAEKQKDIRILGQQEAVGEEIRETCRSILKENVQISRLYTKRGWIKDAFSGIMGLFIYLFAGWQANRGMISIGEVVVYISCILKLTESISSMAMVLAGIKQAALYADDYLEYMNLGDRKYPGTIPVEKRSDHRFQVDFEHVSFRYPGTETDVIKDLTVSFVIGEKMAIVGQNGSGKTTFIKLLCRLYDVTEGCIKLNGIDIRKYDYQEYCDLFSVVFQDFFIFDFELGENIAAGVCPEEERVWDALRKVGLAERAESMQDGIRTFVGKEFDNRGVAFSGGERQKMAIARAIYKDAPLVIMDEPTAALDPLAECEVYAGFDKMVGKKTALYISHRLASCRFCEDILVFDQGRLVQRGSHDVLKEQEGIYRKLWEAQARYYA